MTTTTKSRPATAPAAATRREHLGTVLFGLWMTVGLFLDGYFHQNLDAGTDTESFLTPWHAVFYSGFLASAWWLAELSRRRSGQLDWRLASLPPGYGGARAGLVLFGLGGLGDAAWHTAFGVERGIDALLSPTHLVLFVGLFLILTAPLAAARAVPEDPPRPWMVAGSVIAATALVGFFLNFVWGLGVAASARVAYDPVTDAGEAAVIAGVASTLVTTAVLFTGARAMLAARRPPVGALVLLFGVVALLVSAAFDEDIEGVVAALVGGLVLEVVVRMTGDRERGTPVAFGLASGAMWVAYFGLLAGLDGLEWQAEIWLGAVGLNVLAALALAGPAVARGLTPGLGERSFQES